MARLHRFDLHHQLCFVTCVTAHRAPLLLEKPELFLQSWRGTAPVAWIVLPDHFHTILLVRQATLSSLVHRFKVTYAWHFNESRRYGRLWQSRFWDHWIRDRRDLRKHLDYIHSNPVHHNLCTDPFHWPVTSLGHWCDKGYYQRDWGHKDLPSFDGEFGE